MFSFFCQLPEQETRFRQRQRAFRQCSRFECNLGKICPWRGSSSLLCLTCITPCIHKTDILSQRQLFFVQKDICEDLWKDFDRRQIKAGDFKNIQHLEGQFFPWVMFFTPNIHPKAEWWSSPCLARVWAPLSSHPFHLSLVWNIEDSGILPLA